MRKTDDKALLTIKGEPNATGDTRFEWEKEIAQNEAIQLLDLSLGETIRKNRYVIPHKSHLLKSMFFQANFKG